MHPTNKYPPYPGSSYDYGQRMTAAQQLIPPNKCICIYCREQALFESKLKHKDDCPARNEK